MKWYCPGHADFIKNMISGASQMDGAILVVAADDGPMPQTKEHLLLISQLEIKHLIVYINKVDIVDKDIIELAEMETRELLDKYGFNGINTPFVCGSALLALNGDKSEIGVPSVQLLLNALDNHIPTTSRDYAAPFVLPIDDVFSVPGRGTVVVGTLTQGSIAKSAEAHMVGFDVKLDTHISDIQVFKKSVPKAYAGQNIGVLLRGIKLGSVRRGMVVCQKNSVTPTNHFEAQFYLLDKSEGGRQKPIAVNGFSTLIFCSTWNVYCRFDFLLPPGVDMLMPGEFATAKLTLLYRMPIAEGKVFTVREHNLIIGTGKITKVHKPITFEKDKLHMIKV
ncbi:elongation factor Tu, mitochondrial-like isoform X2 [Nomia melanderi]|uniref:elongation factor Tu, mitochondrial-like isoform X2 n=1 Tax=Nomia melanderi TaxID=2448451 RepID=UPI00130412DF|nr:uncharacterized protein LOC116425134 isoform X2 [Nomia melanderi]